MVPVVAPVAVLAAPVVVLVATMVVAETVVAIKVAQVLEAVAFRSVSPLALHQVLLLGLAVDPVHLAIPVWELLVCLGDGTNPS